MKGAYHIVGADKRDAEWIRTPADNCESQI